MQQTTISYLNPPNTCPAQGLYSHATDVPAGRTLYIAGQLSVGLDGSVVGKNDFAAQMKQVLDNMGAVLKGTGLGFNNVIKFTTYLVHSQDIESFMKISGRDVPEAVRRHAISAQHAADRRAAGEGGIPDRDRGYRVRRSLRRHASGLEDQPVRIATFSAEGRRGVGLISAEGARITPLMPTSGQAETGALAVIQALRLHHPERRDGPRRAIATPAMGSRQVFRHVLSHGPVDRHGQRTGWNRNSRSLLGQRRASPGRPDTGHDLRHTDPDRNLLARHHSLSGRRDRHRHAGDVVRIEIDGVGVIENRFA